MMLFIDVTFETTLTNFTTPILVVEIWIFYPNSVGKKDRMCYVILMYELNYCVVFAWRNSKHSQTRTHTHTARCFYLNIFKTYRPIIKCTNEAKQCLYSKNSRCNKRYVKNSKKRNAKSFTKAPFTNQILRKKRERNRRCQHNA